MKKLFAIWLALTILILSGCKNDNTIAGSQSDPTLKEPTSQTDSVSDQKPSDPSDSNPEFSSTEPVSQTDPTQATEGKPSASTRPSGNTPTTPTKPTTTAGKDDSRDQENPTEGTKPTTPSKPQTDVTQPSATEPSVPAQTDPPATDPPATQPPATEPPATEPPETEPPETEPAPTEPDPEPAVTEITYEFKRQVAAAAVKYINQYRGSSCTVLSGMSSVAQYRASQLTWNYGHSTADKRAALAYYEYGRYIDATEFGDDASNSYWEADSAEAICAGFYGTDPDAMGKKIADLIKNSSGHWSYIGSSEYSYIGVGVEYREGSQYGWYCCVMVGSVNYG